MVDNQFFKDYYSTMAGEENAHKYRGYIFLAGSASAEIVADAALCPFEMGPFGFFSRPIWIIWSKRLLSKTWISLLGL